MTGIWFCKFKDLAILILSGSFLLLPIFIFAQDESCIVITNLPDTIFVCPDSQVQLDPNLETDDQLIIYDLFWTPADGLNDPNVLDPIATMGTQSQEYTLYVEGLILDNLIDNGDFSDGGTGFYTEYTPGNGGPWGLLSYEGTWTTTPDPSLVHMNFTSFFDHTTGDASGSMMVINGASTANTVVWLQNITVKPDTWYDFSAWGASCHPEAPAQLQFRINGVLLGDPFQLPSTTGVWVNFHEKWYSGNNTNAEISIVNQQTAQSGNDFALDDLEFYEICQSSASVFIKVIDLQPEFTYEVIPDCDSDQVIFTMVNIAGDAPDDWIWYFGDGNISTEINPSHTYSPKGVYNVKLIFSKGDCEKEFELQIDTNEGFVPAIADFESEKYLICVGETLHFTSLSEGNLPLEYYWDFGDGNESYDQDPSHSYEEPGEYTVFYSITDDLGCNDFTEIPISVMAYPDIDPVMDQHICFDQTAYIDLSAIAEDIYWFDGSSEKQRIFNEEGFYGYTVVNDADCVVHDTFYIAIDPEPVSHLFAGIICEGDPYEFFGHIYYEPGIYTDTARSAINCDSIYFILELSFAPPATASITADRMRICLGDTVRFFNNSSGSGALNHYWDFGDSGYSESDYPYHIFADPGIYRVSYMLIDENQCTDSDSIEILVSEYPVIDPVGDHFLCYGEVLMLEIENTGEEILWNDGTTEYRKHISSSGIYSYTLTNPTGCSVADTFSVDYSSPPQSESISKLICPGEEFHFLGENYGSGNFHDTLRTWQGCDSVYYSIAVSSITSIGIETDKTDICAGESIFFNSLAEGLPEINYYWDFGDGNISGSKSHSHTFNVPGTYIVQHIIDDAIPCSDTATIEITVFGLPEINHQPDRFECYGEEVLIDLGQYPGDILWNDGNTEKFREIQASGNYTYVIIDENGCSGTDSFNVSFSPAPKVDSMSFTECEGDKLILFGQEYDTPGFYTDTLLNSMGCDSIYNEIQFSYYPRDPILIEGNYGFCVGESAVLKLVSQHSDLLLNGENSDRQFEIFEIGKQLLKVNDRYGCQDSIIFFVEEYPAPEIFIRNMTDEFFESGRQIDVEYYGNPVEFIWNPHLGLDCYDCPHPSVVSKWEGTYTIEVTNEFGCRAQDELIVRYKQIQIYIPNIIYGTAANPKNEVFFVSSNTNFKYDLKVFDRWGNLLFENFDLIVNDHSRGWKPSTKYNPGVYTWMIEYELEGEKITIAGDITLLH